MDTPFIYVADCEFGRGVFAARPFAAGEPVLRFTGRRIGLAETLAKGEAEFNVLQIGDTEYLDIVPPGVFTNHSCEPNVGLQDDITLIALRHLSIHEEIRWDYSTSMWEMHEDIHTMSCRCGSAICRGVVDQFPTLPVEVQTRYLEKGIVMSFISERITRN
ncbi:MAG: SET domain-containing protein-lysine N-methyltransferase [Rhodocyclaceae bacterium]|nr:SET domain-containing protein-lysine N-methyltransferase [Rhodocyclaceae bacterium]